MEILAVVQPDAALLLGQATALRQHLQGLGLHHDACAAIVEYSGGALMDLNVRPSEAQFDASHKASERTACNSHLHRLPHVHSPSKPHVDPEPTATAARKALASAASG